MPQNRSERRQHRRTKQAIDFYCYIDGLRFDSASIDISTGGALLKTGDPVRRDATVMIIPKDEAVRKFPVMLVGAVVRQQEGSNQGVGIRWLRCITRDGIASVYGFMAAFPEFSEIPLPPPTHEVASNLVVGYDFPRNRFYVPKIPEVASLPELDTERPVKSRTWRAEGGAAKQGGHALKDSSMPKTKPVKRASAQRPGPAASRAIVTPPDMSKTDEPGELTLQLKVQHQRIPVELPGKVTSGGHSVEGVIRLMSLKSLFVACEESLEGFGTLADVEVFIPLHKKKARIVLRCDVVSLGRHARLDLSGLGLVINGVDEGDREGVFERYVKYLYYKMLTR